MKKIRPTSFCILFLISNVFIGCAQKNAGVIPYFKSGKNIFVLLADHANKDRGWASFGGKCLEGETNRDTAAREFNEETKFLFENQDILLRIQNSPGVEFGDFVTFFVKVDFIPVFELVNKKMEGAASGERNAFIWLPLNELIRACKEKKEGKYILDKKYLPENYKRNDLFEPFVKAFQIAENKGLLNEL